jgi:hypothetical protein
MAGIYDFATEGSPRGLTCPGSVQNFAFGFLQKQREDYGAD